jgi:hypothetical protein
MTSPTARARRTRIAVRCRAASSASGNDDITDAALGDAGEYTDTNAADT